MKTGLRLLLVAAMLAGTMVLPGVAVRAERPSRPAAVRLIESSDTSVVFEVAVPWEHLQVGPADVAGYTDVTLQDWAVTAVAGAPELPFLAQTLGAPHGAALEVAVQPGPAHVVSLADPVRPAATQVADRPLPTGDELIDDLPMPRLIVERDETVYGGGSPYPDVLARVTADGSIRGQRVVGISAYPVQYQPSTRELTVYEWLRITVTFTGQAQAFALQVESESPVYEGLFHDELLNYEQARNWRAAARPAAAAATENEGTGIEGADAGALAWAPPAVSWRIRIKNTGLYRLTYNELLAAGVLTGSPDPRKLQLYYLGNPVAIYVVGEADGVFDATDSLIFFGQALSSKYTSDNVYWLTVETVNGLRMASRDGTPAAASTPAYYPARLERETNLRYVPLAPGDDHLDRWTWARILASNSLPASWSTTFSLAAPYSGLYAGALSVNLLGYVDYGIPLDHHVRVSLNGNTLGDVWWDGITWRTATFDVARSQLLVGTNTLLITCPNDTGAGSDQVQVNRFELSFANTFYAESNVLAFSYATAGRWKYQIGNFTTATVDAYDVTSPTAVVRITGVASTSGGGGTYTASFEDTVSTAADYRAVGSTGYLTVAGIELDTPSNLQSTSLRADYILIAHRTFWSQAQQLATFRDGQGWRVILVDVQDIYDEFGYGIVGAVPIHDFLAYARLNWLAPAPSFVVLVGDGHYDPKNYYGYGLTSFIPPYLAFCDPWMGETAADNRYVTLDGADKMPDMMLGRLAVDNTAEATAFVNKIIAYEQTPEAGPWTQRVLAVADDLDPAAGDFASLSDSLLDDLLPGSFSATKVYYKVTHPTVDGARAAILAGINTGALLVNYIGHAGITVWAGEQIFRATDVAGLTNGARMPVVLAMACYEGHFIYPPADPTWSALAEVITRAAGKGAVASWSPTGMGMSSGHDLLNRGFFEAAFWEGLPTIGHATLAGKLMLWGTGASPDLLDTYLLFGDPASQMPVAPTAVDLLSFTATAGKSAIELRWETGSEFDSLGFNVYRAETEFGPSVQLNQSLIVSEGDGPMGGVYTFRDVKAKQKRTYYYWLESLDLYGGNELYGPVSAKRVK